MALPSVLVLAGGPDAERAISLQSGRAVAAALQTAGHAVEFREIDTPDADALRAMGGEVVFPVLHGVWGEGGALQSLLASDQARPFVGCGPVAARLAMDKLATKIAAGQAGVRTPAAGVVRPQDDRCCVALPAVVKPVHEGSSVGLHLCADEDAWEAALGAIRADRTPGRVYMAESMVRGRELTVGIVEDGRGGFLDLPLVEIVSSSGVYDYDAKYTRGDTRYILGPDLGEGVREEIVSCARRVAARVGVRHLSRLDFLLDGGGTPWLLEVNTMPGFTATSLLPKAAGAVGIALPDLVSRLVMLAARDRDGANRPAVCGG